MILVRPDTRGVATADAVLAFGVARHQRLLYLKYLISTRMRHKFQNHIALK